ncbi:hypothetical protein Tco_0256211 [Tanacetum coccineum]
MEDKIKGPCNGRREQIRHDDEIVLARVRTSTLEILIEDIQTRSFTYDNLEAELQKARAQIAKFQRNQLGNNNKIALARFRIANLEQIIEEIQVRHQADKESLLNAIYELKNSQKGPSDY